MRKADALSAILVAGNLRDDLGRDVAGCGKAVRALDQCLADHGAVLQHILQVYKIAVVHMLCKIVGVMEVDDSLLIRLNNIFRKKKSSREILADFASHIVTLYTVDGRVLVGVLLHNLFVVALDQGQDPVVRRICFPHQRAVIAVAHIIFCDRKSTDGHQLVLDHILNLLYRHSTSQLIALILYIIRNIRKLFRCQIGIFCGVARLLDRIYDLERVKTFLRSVSFDDLHP